MTAADSSREASRPYMCIGFRAAAKFDGQVMRLTNGDLIAIFDLFRNGESVQFYSSAHLRELAEVASRLADEFDAREALDARGAQA